MKNWLLFISFFVGVTTGFAGGNPDDIIGVWQNGTGKGHVQIYKTNGRYFGKVVWIRDTRDMSGRIKTDKKNPDPALRERPIVGMQMLRDFVYKDDEWIDGKLYNPEDGKEYRCIMSLKNKETLRVRGYIGFSWIGKTDVWTRVASQVNSTLSL
jgi:uncharacterized protein (DUF2147 family)